jgi:hypothetical protein
MKLCLEVGGDGHGHHSSTTPYICCHGHKLMRDLLISKVQVFGSDGLEFDIRVSHDSPGRVCNPEMILSQ